jgi:putative phosphoesterase
LGLRIGVVADTHMPSRAKTLPEALVRGLEGVELILHAGDFTSLETVEMLERIAPLEGVIGNNDGYEIFQRFSKIKLLNIGGFRIGLIHGDGSSKTTERRSLDAFQDSKPDLVVFGHSHVPYKQLHDGILLFNPGSPTDKRKQPLYSYGILEIGDRLAVRHHYYEEK